MQYIDISTIYAYIEILQYINISTIYAYIEVYNTLISPLYMQVLRYTIH